MYVLIGHNTHKILKVITAITERYPHFLLTRLTNIYNIANYCILSQINFNQGWIQRGQWG
jgi:hypothetical protein